MASSSHTPNSSIYTGRSSSNQRIISFQPISISTPSSSNHTPSSSKNVLTYPPSISKTKRTVSTVIKIVKTVTKVNAIIVRQMIKNMIHISIPQLYNHVSVSSYKNTAVSPNHILPSYTKNIGKLNTYNGHQTSSISPVSLKTQ